MYSGKYTYCIRVYLIDFNMNYFLKMKVIMIERLKFIPKVVVLGLFLILQNTFIASRQNSSADDAFTGIQYSQAFDQTAIYNKYRTLLEKMGCADNVFQSDADVDSITRKIGSVVTPIQKNIVTFDPVVDAQELAAFERECLGQLNYTRRMTLATPTFGAATDLAWTGLIAGTAAYLIKDTVSNGFTQTNALYTAAYGAIAGFKSAYNLIFWPDNSLEDLEDQFAKNKCFIPRSLWSKIMKEFMAARQDSFNRDSHTHFIDFALGFTVYKPKPTMYFKDNMTVLEVKNKLNNRIDRFFSDYQDAVNIDYIKINVAKFIDTLSEQHVSTTVQIPRYLYLYGSGGIGKTHFVQTLSEWINELIPSSVLFEDVIINSSDDLEGSEQRPGAFLKALRKQLMQNKRGSVIIMDEATWLNSGSMVSPAKRIFNGDRSKLATSYFGSNMDGSGVSLEIPPMLVFVASNEGLADPALASRFDMILYPAPSEQALIDYAINIAEKSQVLQDAHCPIDKNYIAEFIQNVDPQVRNFRLVAGNVEAVLLAHQKQLMIQQLIASQKPVIKNQKSKSLSKTVARK